jgi:hypothetical protein
MCYPTSCYFKSRTYPNNSQKSNFQVGTIHELPLQFVLLRKSYKCLKPLRNSNYELRITFPQLDGEPIAVV